VNLSGTLATSPPKEDFDAQSARVLSFLVMFSVRLPV
jgi:hypothetical protein